MNQKLPKHIAIVMDGNGRWAENHQKPRMEGHKAGVKSVKTIIQGCLKKGIPCLSLFAFSRENWSRPEEEVNFLMQLFIDGLEQELDELHHSSIKLRFIGEREPLSELLKEKMEQAEILTQNNQQLLLNIVVNYGGKWDIVHAAKKLATLVANGSLKPEAIDENIFETFLDTAGLPEVDMFIRPGGELRISNFFLWQLAYTELYFTDIHWPDFSLQAFERALEAFSQRNRRFGRISTEAS